MVAQNPKTKPIKSKAAACWNMADHRGFLDEFIKRRKLDDPMTAEEFVFFMDFLHQTGLNPGLSENLPKSIEGDFGKNSLADWLRKPREIEFPMLRYLQVSTLEHRAEFAQSCEMALCKFMGSKDASFTIQ